MKGKAWKIIAVMMITMAVSLAGCGNESAVEENDPVADAVVNEETDTNENDAVMTGYDVQAVLEEAENAANVIETRLMEDASLTQMDMNDLSMELYQIWDGVLNDVWAELKITLDEEAMDDLLQEQREWITEKEAAVKEAGDEFAGGSMAPLASNQKAAELTRSRAYELASYLGFE